MPPKIIKLDPKEDIASVIQKIKKFKEREIVFEMQKGALLLTSSDNLRLMRKTGVVLGKTIKVKPDANDKIGQIIAHKAEALFEDDKIQPVLSFFSKIKRSDVLPRLGDIRTSKFPKKSSPKPASFNKTEREIVEVSKTAASKISDFSKPFLPKISKLKNKFNWTVPGFSKKISKIFVIIVAALVIIVLILAIALPQVSVKVYARSEPISRDMEVTVNKKQISIDSDKMIIPGNLVVKELAKTSNFSTTGVKLTGNKTAGEVRLYNFTKNTLTLRAATTTLVANGKKYFFTKDVTGLRPTARLGNSLDGEIDQSTLISSIPIIAENPGETYNLPVNTKFEIENAALGKKDVYAINQEALGGGDATAGTVLSQEDEDKAAASLIEQLLNDAQSDLSREAGTTVRLLPSGSNMEVLAKTANQEVGEEVPNFDMTVIVRINALSFKQDDLVNLIDDKIKKVLSDDKYLVEDAKQQLNVKFSSVNLPEYTGVLSVHYETTVAYKVDDSNLSKILSGKTASEIKEILLTKPEIDRVDVKFSPFFVKRAPRFNGKIYIDTELSQ